MVTCPSTRLIFACLFLYHLDNKYDYSFQQLTENWSRSAEKNTNPIPTTAHLKKTDSGFSIFKKLIRIQLQRKTCNSDFRL